MKTRLFDHDLTEEIRARHFPRARGRRAGAICRAAGRSLACCVLLVGIGIGLGHLGPRAAMAAIFGILWGTGCVLFYRA